MRNMNEFTDRVTLCEDGIYRWYYDLDLKENPGFMGRVVRIVGIICAAMCVLTLAMFSTDRSRFNMETAKIILGAYAGCFILTWGCCRLVASMRRISRIYYEMNDDAVTVVRTPRQEKTVKTIAVIGTLAGIAAGKPGGALRSAALMNGADTYGLTWFSNIRAMKEAPERNEIDLREVFGTNMIWIPKQDYALVRDHLAARLPEKAKDGRNGRMWKRLGLAFVISVAVNACCGWINYTVFQQTNRMPIARTVASPGSGILAMTGIGGWSTYYTGAGLPGHPEWKYGLQFDAMLALFTVIALALLLFAAMSACGRLARIARGDR